MEVSTNKTNQRRRTTSKLFTAKYKLWGTYWGVCLQDKSSKNGEFCLQYSVAKSRVLDCTESTHHTLLQSKWQGCISASTFDRCDRVNHVGGDLVQNEWWKGGNWWLGQGFGSGISSCKPDDLALNLNSLHITIIAVTAVKLTGTILDHLCIVDTLCKK